MYKIGEKKFNIDMEILCDINGNVSSIKSGKVVVVLNGRYAGRKAIVVKTFDEGRADRKFGHCIGMYLS